MYQFRALKNEYKEGVEARHEYEEHEERNLSLMCVNESCMFLSYCMMKCIFASVN